MTLRRTFLLGTAAAVLALGAAAQAADPAKKDLVFGATAGYNYDVLKLGIVPQLEKQGYKVKLVEFNDYVQPNLALAQGSLDANLFQHIAYLNRFKADQKLDLVDLVQSTTAPMGIYSKSRKSLADLKEGDRFTLPNDPSNLARALLLLQQNRVITVKADVDPLRVTEKDLASNPKKVKLQPVEAAQLPRTVGDAEFAVVPGNFAIASGLKLTAAVALETPPVQFQQVVAIRRADQGKPWARDLAAAFKSPFFKSVLDKDFPGYVRPAGL
ncbi:MetQ/NlpA family ABC transporter substrate-binding protein [Pigmentiphaga sp.]|uniref:MetQ/NlpA family ABC transporter substrate-binding protein n=1 Tax=Pigmentiphaga sp. TaxID=1977564 RepID=UPI00128B5E5C|nr:MetQ/NlpA family ABC transporter substrate-binding protein [Pigmentiphaga sp.]MPS30051.1 metal ABC transporter substrate-binding protein [Alcaligenaceae bacterium SAGV5]MPS55173.1 metal ABC transporter substrate-binding protein [Alcaligenaceae bacterium SAGV3]MPT57864.1 metal ABC transporter substrate-binding protein [Alcaligenaceae bacterium]